MLFRSSRCVRFASERKVVAPAGLPRYLADARAATIFFAASGVASGIGQAPFVGTLGGTGDILPSHNPLREAIRTGIIPGNLMGRLNL